MARPATDIETKRSQKLKRETKWRQVKAPRHWRPKEGDELVGHFRGYTRLAGMYGEYTAALIHVPYKGRYFVNGTTLIRLIDASELQVDDPVRIVFDGWKDLENERRCKLFTLFVEDLD